MVLESADMDFRRGSQGQQQGGLWMCQGSNPLPAAPAQVDPSSIPFNELGRRSQTELGGQGSRGNDQGSTHYQSSIGGLDQRCFRRLDDDNNNNNNNNNFIIGQFANSHADLDRAAAIRPFTADRADGANPVEPTPSRNKSGSSARSIRSVHWDDVTEDEMSDDKEHSSLVASSPRRTKIFANPDPYCQVDDYGSPRERRRRAPILHASPGPIHSPSTAQTQHQVLRRPIALPGHRAPISAPRFAPSHSSNGTGSEVVGAVAAVGPKDHLPVPDFAPSYSSGGGAFSVVIRSLAQPRQDAGPSGRAQVKRTRDDLEGTATMAARDIAREKEIRVSNKFVAPFDWGEEEASEITPSAPKSCHHRRKSRRTGGSGRAEEMNDIEIEEEVDNQVRNQERV